MRRFFGCLVAAGLLCQAAWGFDPFVIGDVRVLGLQRISAGTVFNALPVKVGERIDPGRSSGVIRELYKTGFFQDVRLEREGDVLVVTVVERPAIASITITGNKTLETEDLLAALEDIGLAEGQVFDLSLFDRVQQELRRQYFSQGKYGVTIDTTQTPLEGNRVALGIDIVEGLVAKILQINIVGNSAFSDKQLLKTFQLSTPTLFSFYTRSDQYSKQKLAADLETLRSYYLDRGFINFQIDSTQVSITPDKKDIYITINVTEADRYTISQLKLAGELVVDAEELFPLIESRVGSEFSRKETTRTQSQLIERLGEEGYAFANVNTIPEIDEETKQVELTFFVDPGRRVYVRRVNLEGNTRTRDEVIRRELLQMESAWISTVNVKRSRDRIDRLGYFDEVTVQTPAVPGTTDQVDVDLKVKEKPSGNLLAGIGFSQTAGVIINTSISQSNFLGSGKRMAFTFNNSAVNTNYTLGYSNPYYTIDGISRGFRAFFRKTDAGSANVTDYSTDVFGGSVSFGMPLSEFDRLRFDLEYEDVTVNLGSRPSREVAEFIADNGDHLAAVKFVTGWSHDTRNSAIFATRGSLQTLNAEVAVPGPTLQFYKLRYKHLRYRPLTRTLTLLLNLDLAYGKEYGRTEGYPFFENFFAGGPKDVRGFEANTLGPRDSKNDPIGGNIKSVANVELIFPPPFGAATSSFRLSAFLDAGNVFDDEFETSDIRVSSGLAAKWLSPVGALTFSLAVPFNDDGDDDVQHFQFTFGQTF